MRRVAMITGGARGLGRAIAERLAGDGLEVMLCDLDLDEARRAAAEMPGGAASAIGLDVADEDAVASAFAEARRRHGRLDVLVNNAGVPALQDGRMVGIEETRLATWERIQRVNVIGTMLMCRAAIPLMRGSTAGRIVNMSSRAARGRSGKCITAYAASKAAIIGFSQALAHELADDGITVNCVAPSTIRTAMTDGTSGGSADYFARAAANTALGRLGTAEDVADAVAFLASPEARHVSGAVVDVNGGATMA